MENQIVKSEQANLPVLSEKKLMEFLDIAGVGRNLPADKRKQFVEIAQAYQLNPFKREIYCVGYKENTSIITGYEVYIKRAERTGKLNGWNVEVEGEGKELTATIIIHRSDWAHPFKHEVYFEEAANRTKDGELNSIWKKMPKFMLKKVAIAQGFRLCFSDELGGMPYTNDEIGEPEDKKQVVEAEVVKQAEPAQEAEVVEIPEDALRALEACTTAPMLLETCRGVAKSYGDKYRPVLQQYYNEHKNKLGA